MPLRVGIRKWLASTATIGSGGSAGAEGPIVTIGAAAGSAVAKLLGTGSQHTGTLLGCGAAAGLASVFNAPIAGVFFVMELLLRDFSLRTFAPIVIAAVVSSATTQGVLGDAAIFSVDSEFFHQAVGFSASQIPAYLVLGLVCGLLGAVFVRALDFTERTFASSKLPLATRPIVGALLSGASAYRHLRNSVEAFPEPEDFAVTLEEVGVKVRHLHRLGFGACVLFEGEVPA